MTSACEADLIEHGTMALQKVGPAAGHFGALRWPTAGLVVTSIQHVEEVRLPRAPPHPTPQHLRQLWVAARALGNQRADMVVELFRVALCVA